MAKTRRGKGRITDMFKQKIASSAAQVAEAPLDKAALRLNGALDANNNVIGRMDSQGNAVFGQNNPMFKRAGRKTRKLRKLRKAKKVSRRRQ